jgi:thioredoxin-like negative regulator of GroEL
MKYISEYRLLKHLRNTKFKTIVFFSTQHNHECIKIGKQLEEWFSRVESKPIIYKIDMGKTQRIDHDFRIMTLPALFVFYKGIVIARIDCIKSECSLITQLENLLN